MNSTKQVFKIVFLCIIPNLVANPSPSEVLNDIKGSTYHGLGHLGKSATIRESNHGSVYVRSFTRSTMYQKAETGVWKISIWVQLY